MPEEGSSASPDASLLVRRCGIEYNEAVFLLEAAAGDVRKALELQRSYSSWAGAEALTTATLSALSRASPAGESPSSPTLSSSPKGVSVLKGQHWPSMRQAVAALSDWSLLDGESDDEDFDSDSEEEWIEIDCTGEEGGGNAKQTFLQVLEKQPPKPRQRPAGQRQIPGPGPSFTDRTRPDRTGETSEQQFEFDDDCAFDLLGQRPSVRGGHRNGHTKHTKKCEQTKAERRGKRAAKKAARKLRKETRLRECA